MESILRTNIEVAWHPRGTELMAVTVLLLLDGGCASSVWIVPRLCAGLAKISGMVNQGGIVSDVKDQLSVSEWTPTWQIPGLRRTDTLRLLATEESYGHVEKRLDDRDTYYEWRRLLGVSDVSVEEFQTTDQPLALSGQHDLNRGVAVVTFTDVEGEQVREFDEYGFLNINRGAAKRFAENIQKPCNC